MKLAYGHWIQQRIESWGTRHFHSVADDGSVYIVGNGEIVMRVAKPSRRAGGGFAEIIGLDGKNEHGEPFVYADYFLPEEIETASETAGESDIGHAQGTTKCGSHVPARRK